MDLYVLERALISMHSSCGDVVRTASLDVQVSHFFPDRKRVIFLSSFHLSLCICLLGELFSNFILVDR